MEVQYWLWAVKGNVVSAGDEVSNIETDEQVPADVLEQHNEEVLPADGTSPEDLETNGLSEGIDKVNVDSRGRDSRPSKSTAAAAAAAAAAADASAPDKETMNIIFIGHVGKSCVVIARSVCDVLVCRCWEVDYWRPLDVSHRPG